MHLGELVYAYRKEHDLSMDEFAAKCGLSKGYISMLEKNKNPQTGKPIIPSLDTIRQISNAIDMDLNEIIQMLDAHQEIRISNNTEAVEPNPSIISIRLREAMDSCGMKQSDIVERTGINKGALSSYLSGKYEPKQQNLYKLAQALGVSESWLRGVDENKQNLSNVPNADFAKNDEERKVLLIARKADELPPEKREKVINFFEETIDTYLAAMGDIFHKNNSEGEQ